jgi:hypothetical protein
MVYLPFFLYPFLPAKWLFGKTSPITVKSCVPIFAFASMLALAHIITRVMDQGSSLLFLQGQALLVPGFVYVSAVLWPILIIYGMSKLRTHPTQTD